MRQTSSELHDGQRRFYAASSSERSGSCAYCPVMLLASDTAPTPRSSITLPSTFEADRVFLHPQTCRWRIADVLSRFRRRRRYALPLRRRTAAPAAHADTAIPTSNRNSERISATTPMPGVQREAPRFRRAALGENRLLVHDCAAELETSPGSTRRFPQQPLAGRTHLDLELSRRQHCRVEDSTFRPTRRFAQDRARLQDRQGRQAALPNDPHRQSAWTANRSRCCSTPAQRPT